MTTDQWVAHEPNQWLIVGACFLIAAVVTWLATRRI